LPVSGREAPTTPRGAFATSSMRARFSFFWIPRPADTMMSAPAMSMSWTCGRSIDRNRVRAFDESIRTGIVVTVPPAAGPAGFTEPGRTVTTMGRLDAISTSAWTFSFRRRRVAMRRSPSKRKARQFVTSGRSIAPASAGARSKPWDVWATRIRRGFALSTTARAAWPYPSGVYSANAGSSARRTSVPVPARTSARTRTSCPKSATRAWPPERDPSSRPTAIASNVDGATWPSRCSARIRTSPGSPSPPSEPFVPEELREFLRLLVDGPGDHLRMALRRGRRELSDGERVRERNGLPGCETESRGRELLDRLAGRFHDRRERRVPRRVRAELNREHGRERDRIEPLQSGFELAKDLEPLALQLPPRHDTRLREAEEGPHESPR